jgi:small Trp-rich protein
MGFLIVGLLLGALYLAGIGPVASWHWGWILLPFALAAVWWTVMDASGTTMRRAMRKMDERKVARRERDMKALGLDVRSDQRVRAMRGGAGRSDPESRDPRS